MTPFKALTAVLTSTVLLSGCAAPPMGPSMAALPSPNKPYEVFAADDASCRQYAGEVVRGQVDAANDRGVGTAVIGTILGAGLGAAVGGGRGAGIGAASGAIVGTSVGAGNTGRSQYSIQRQYDNAFFQCMHAKGNQVPGAMPITYAPPPPPLTSAPPPPPPPPQFVAPATNPGYGVEPGAGPQDRELIRSIQVELKRLGMLDVADGEMGPRTRSAISAFQRIKGMDVGAPPSPSLLEALRATG